MSEVRPIARDLFIETLLYELPPTPPLTVGAPVVAEPGGEEDPDPLGDFDLMECLEGSNQVALRLACIGDEMDLRLRSPRLAQLPGMAMHSLALTYSQTGVGGVLRGLIHGLRNLRDHIRAWGFPAPSTWVSPDQACRELLTAALLAILLLGGTWHLLLQ